MGDPQALHAKLVIWINEEERGETYRRYGVRKVESARDGWNIAECYADAECVWDQTGYQNNCVEAGYAHVAERHRTGYLAALDALRAVVELHRPVSIGLTRITDGQDVPMCKACSFGSFCGGQPLVRVGWADCLTIRAVAGELGVDLT